MKNNRENLIKLLKFITEISNEPENEWFKRDLLQFLNESQINKINFKDGGLEAKVNLIQEYLYLDIKSLIDYDEFDFDSKDQLTRDCIEMIRYHKETPNHKKNFDEFCRYAHLQLEEMLNYFFIKKFKTLTDIVNIIKSFNENYLPKVNPRKIEQIPFLTKIIAFYSFAKPQYTYPTHATIVFLNDMRNEVSHRSSLTKKNNDVELGKFQQLFPKYPKGDIINFITAQENEKEIWNRGIYIMRKRDQDFSSIYESILLFKNIIIKFLNSSETINPKSSIGNANPILQSFKDNLEKK